MIPIIASKNIFIAGRKIFFENTEPVEFKYDIKETLVIENVIIMLINSPTKVIFNQNVFAFSLEGDFLWQIEKTKLFHDTKDCLYTGVMLNKENELVLCNWCATAVVVNCISGEVLRKYPIK